MMMTRKLIFLSLLSLVFVVTTSAADTTQTPTPAEVISAAAVVNSDAEALMQNDAVNERTIRLNPRAVSFVQDYMAKNRKNLMAIKDKGLPYFNLMDEILVQHGLPTELKYLAVIESKLNSSAVSHAGAVGPWQFMSATAKNYGLKISKYKDERRDYRKSTHAAAKYLKYLHNEFGDWLLAIAAYNGGPGYVYNAIKKSKSRNFWDLQYYLPAESRNHVKKFISTHYVFEGNGGICTLTKAEATEQIGSLAGYLMNRNLTAEELKNSSTTTISGKYRAAVVAKYINMDMEEFERYNPQFDKVIDGEYNSYELKLPAMAMEKFVANKYPILNESVQLMLSETAAELPKKQQTTAIK
jgi:membrane-bound lytic murein transglycosylase D